MILLNPRLYINAKLFFTSGIPPAHMMELTHGGDLHTERTYTWSGLTHGGDIHTEGHIHRGDVHMKDQTCGGINTQRG